MVYSARFKSVTDPAAYLYDGMTIPGCMLNSEYD